MKKFGYLLIYVLIISSLSCSKKNEEINNKEESGDLPETYLDSTYFSFLLNSKEIRFAHVYGGFGGRIERTSDGDSVIIGCNVDADNLQGENLYLSFYFKIDEDDLNQSDTTNLDAYFKIHNYDTLIRQGNFRFRNDFLDTTKLEGIDITYFDKNSIMYTTNLQKNYEKIYNVTIPREEMDPGNSCFIIEQRKNLMDGHFVIRGRFETDIYNEGKNEFERLAQGHFYILMYH